MATPAISICIPVYNRAVLVAKAIESALDQQNLRDAQILVVDNASTDSTWEVICAYRDPRLLCHRNPQNLGAIGNFNRCLKLARGKYIRILCSDDKLLPNAVQAEVQLMDAHPEVAVLSSPAQVCDERGKRLYVTGEHLSPGIYPKGCATVANLLWILAAYGYNPLNFPSGILFRRQAMEQTGSFEPVGGGTWDLGYWLRMLRYGGLGIAPQPSCIVLSHQGADSVPLLSSGGYLAGQFTVIRQWRTCLDEQGLGERVSAHLEARAYWLALKMAGAGQMPSAGRYWRMTTFRHRRRWRSLGALALHLGYRSRRRWAGTHLSRQNAMPW